MKTPARRQSLWRSLPLIGFLISEWKVWGQEVARPHYRLASPDQNAIQLPPYPLDMVPLLALPHGTLDEHGVPYNAPTPKYPAAYQPTTIAQYGLAQWNIYLQKGDEQHRQAFLIQANWLVEHEVLLPGGAGCWPIPFPSPDHFAPQPWLSALTQGNVISVLVRAYWLTGEERFIAAAHRAASVFERDILDAGVSAFWGNEGVFFEEVAVYPAAHILNGYIFALFGLYDYVALTHNSQITALIQRSLATLHTWLDDFDTGYWSRYDLFRHLAPPFYHDLHVLMLRSLAQLSGCTHCARLADRWEGYQHRRWCRLRYFVASRMARYGRGLRRLFFGPVGARAEKPLPICVPSVAFPVAGGIRSVLTGVAQAMTDEWSLEHLTRLKGPGAEAWTIDTFGGSALATPWQFPFVWLYAFAGWCKLLALLRRRRGHYCLVLAQDGVFTGAFAALAAKMAGVPVVCMDHGTITLPYSETYQKERIQALHAKHWLVRPFYRLSLLGYWPSLRLLARIAIRFSDGFLAAGEDVAETYRERLGVDPSKIILFPFMLDANRFTPPGKATRSHWRNQHGMADDTILITMINRLSPAKGIDLALRGIRQALSSLAPEVRNRVRLVLAGNGPLRPQIEADIRHLGLEEVCILWGEATPTDVVALLGATDIFLYTATRGINSMAVLEAMAAGCTVVASRQPNSLAKLLADGRGITIPAGDVDAISAALAQTLADPSLCQQMGQRARTYVITHHTAQALRRCLQRALYWPSLSREGSAASIQETVCRWSSLAER